MLGWMAWSKGSAAVEALLKEAEAAAPGDQAMQVHHGLLALERGDPRRAISILGPILPRLPSAS